MRDLRSYFKAECSSINDEISPKPIEETSRKFKTNAKVSNTTPKSTRTGTKRRTPKIRKKLSPKCSPSEGFKLLFNSFFKESPPETNNNTEMENRNVTRSEEDQDSLEIVEVSDTPTSTKKLNAFQVLMNGRNKVIGSNSPGKELICGEDSQETSPQNLSGRKRLLQTWSDSIRAKKRKMDDDEIDKCIKIKLNDRKKRLKFLLQVDDDSADEVRDTSKSREKRNSSKYNKNVAEESSRLHLKKVKSKVEDTEEENLCKSQTQLSNKSFLSSGDDFDIQSSDKICTPKRINTNGKRVSSDLENLPSTPKSSWKMKIKLLCNESNDASSNKHLGTDVVHLDEEDSPERKTECFKTLKTHPVEKISQIDVPSESNRVLRDRNSLKRNKIVDFVQISDDSDDEVKKKKNKNNIKVAPIFERSKPKEKVDPKVLEARRKFLMSDMPDALRKKFGQQASNGQVQDTDFDVFPKISHVYQRERNDDLWNLPDQNLQLKNDTPLDLPSINLICQSLIDRNSLKTSRYNESAPIKNIKKIRNDLKEIYSNYPVYKVFRLLGEKNGSHNQRSSTKSTPKRKKRNSSGKGEQSKEFESQIKPEFQMWTEKYKPRSAEDFFGNIQAVSSLKKWLEKWREVFESGKRKKKSYSSDSDSEFVSSDADSVYDRSLSNTVVLTGPCGSGKSSSVYAVCNELGLNVLELNASSRRTGKHILQELQEATQSHQVRKNKGGLDSFTEKKHPSKRIKDAETTKSKKMCVLLIEDIDIVFEQDEGFISAISQISAMSKRPIILTTTDENSVYAQKFINEFRTINYHPSSVQNLGIWLQILCVLEGIYIDLSYIKELLEYNRGDLRKTLLELQFWVHSGGQMNKSKAMLDPIGESESLKEDLPIPISDDTVELNQYGEKFENCRVHTNILSDFEIFQVEKFYNIPFRIDLRTLWWNIPKFLCPVQPKPKTKKSLGREKKKMKMITDMYDSLATFDVSYRRAGYKTDEPVCKKRWHYRLQDSLELDERITDVSVNEDILELNHFLADAYLERCKNKFIYECYHGLRLCDMALPRGKNGRKLENDHKYEEELLSPVPFFNSLDHKSTVLDYLPCIRTVARTENTRAKSNMKRNKRFYNYLQTLNINCDTPILDFAIQTFSSR